MFEGKRGGALRDEFLYFAGCALAGQKPKIGTPEEGYGPPGFIASGLVFPENGCWEVTYRIGRSSVTFVVNVRP